MPASFAPAESGRTASYIVILTVATPYDRRGVNGYKIVEDPEDDGHHKSYEGAMDVTFSYGDYFTSMDEEDLDCVKIELHCYLLINGRHEEWWGKTFEEALDKATVGINHILEAYGA